MDPVVIKMWADALSSVLVDVMLLVLIAGIIALIVFGIKNS